MRRKITEDLVGHFEIMKSTQHNQKRSDLKAKDILRYMFDNFVPRYISRHLKNRKMAKRGSCLNTGPTDEEFVTSFRDPFY